MAARGLGIDEGTATVKAVAVEKQGGTWVPVAAASVPAAKGGGADPGELAAALKEAGIKESAAVVGLTGKDLVIRYQQVPAVPDWQLRQIMDFEVAEIARQSGDELAADFNLLPVASDLSSDDTVLLSLTREPRVNERTDALKAAGLKARYFTPNALGLYHAFRLYGPAASGDVLVASIGRTSSDLVILRDGDLLYARSVNTGGEALNEALVQQFNVSAAKAEKLKREMGDLRPRERRKGLTPQQEKVSYALETAVGRLFQMVQSTVQFARTQVQLNQLQPTKVFVTGGSANMPGLAEYLEGSLHVPVAVFDPLGDAGVEVVGEASTPDLTVALGLAVMAADGEAYSIEVLGAAMRRARAFQERHVFTVLAVVLVLAYLAFAWVRTGEEYDKAVANHRLLTVEKNKRDGNAARLKRLAEERDLLADRVDRLEKRRAAGEGLVRTMALLAQHLPDELWVDRISVEAREADKKTEASPARRPVILVEGRGKSLGDRAVNRAYDEFIEAMRADPDVPRGRFVDTPPTDRENFRFTLELDFLERPATGAEDTADSEDEG